MNWIEFIKTTIFVVVAFMVAMAAYVVGHSNGVASMGVECMQIIVEREVKQSEIRRNASESRKNDSETLFNLSLLEKPIPVPSPGPTPQQFKGEESF